MLDTNAFLKSPYFEEVKSSLAFIKRIKPYARHISLPMGTRLCLPTPTKLSSLSSIDSSVIQRELHNLMRRHWARKYKQGDCTTFVLGKRTTLFAAESITRQFRKAHRKHNGAVQCSEWRWLPLEEWNCITLWQMIQDKGEERNILIRPLGSGLAHRKRLKELLIKVGPSVARQVGLFFVTNFKALQIYFKWYGDVHAGLFCGFFASIRDIQERGMPNRASHDRGQLKDATQLVEDEWREF